MTKHFRRVVPILDGSLCCVCVCLGERAAERRDYLRTARAKEEKRCTQKQAPTSHRSFQKGGSGEWKWERESSDEEWRAAQDIETIWFRFLLFLIGRCPFRLWDLRRFWGCMCTRAGHTNPTARADEVLDPIDSNRQAKFFLQIIRPTRTQRKAAYNLRQHKLSICQISPPSVALFAPLFLSKPPNNIF
jgi:hypothetical protein